MAKLSDKPDVTVYSYTPDVVVVNRAPVLTAWAAVVVHTMGHAWETALTVGKVLTTRFAQAKGQRLGIISANEAAATVSPDTWRWSSRNVITIMGEHVSVRGTPGGPRALGDRGAVLRAESVDEYVTVPPGVSSTGA